MKVLICDDLREESGEFEDAIREAGQPDIHIERLFGTDLKEELNALLDSADAFLGEDGDTAELAQTAFDNAIDLVVLDNNLAHLGIQGARLTAEAIAGHIRAFSSAPYIVSINKNPDIDFDLRYLIGDYTTRADLAVNADHLSNPALWTHQCADAKNGFFPWYWPKLLAVGVDRRKKIEFVEGRLDNGVCDALGVTPEIFGSFSRHTQSLLSLAGDVNEDDAGKIDNLGLNATFRGVFLASARSLPNKGEREILLKKLDEGVADVGAIIARVVAAEIDFWFRRDVLGPQEVLVDIPHLLMRMPFLLGKKANDIEAWNTAAGATQDDGPPFGLDSSFFETHLTNAVFQEGLWSPFPCFWWPVLRENNGLNAYFSTGGLDWADVVFCEDRSEFLHLDPNADIPSPLEFVAQFEGSWNRRYVADIEGIRYAPKTRFAR